EHPHKVSQAAWRSGADMKLWRVIGLCAAALVLAEAVAVAVLVYRPPQPAVSAELQNRKPDPKRGAYVAVLADCVACHTAPGGATYVGGLAFATPLGAVYSTNITPDADTGIGRYSLTEFIRLMRYGVARDGYRVYPAMPYTAFAKASDEDLQDLL